jgi:uncharacterized membrane protein
MLRSILECLTGYASCHSLCVFVRRFTESNHTTFNHQIFEQATTFVALGANRICFAMGFLTLTVGFGQFTLWKLSRQQEPLPVQPVAVA